MRIKYIFNVIWMIGFQINDIVSSSAENSEELKENSEPQLSYNENHLLGSLLQLHELSKNIIKSIGSISTKIGNIEADLMSMKADIGNMDAKIGGMDEKLEEIKRNIRNLDENIGDTDRENMNPNSMGELNSKQYSLQNELEPLISLSIAIEKYREEQAEKLENSSFVVIHHDNNSFSNLPTGWFRDVMNKEYFRRRSSCYTLRKELNYRKSGVYSILIYKDKTEGLRTEMCESSLDAYCDMESDDGGWTVFQRRGISGYLTDNDRSDLFNKKWDRYKNGFGDPNYDYWLGLDAIHSLTKDCNHEILITATALNGTFYQALYSNFSVASEESKYRLTVDGYIQENSTLQNKFTFQSGQSFSTIDKDNDNWSNHCSKHFTANGFWFKDCYRVSLNGIYPNDYQTKTLKKENPEGISWHHNQEWLKLKKTEIKIRPNC